MPSGNQGILRQVINNRPILKCVPQLGGNRSMFRRSIIPNVLCSEGPIFRRSYVPKLRGYMFRWFYFPKVLCSECAMLRRFYVPNVLCSEKKSKVLYIPMIPCSKKWTVLYSEGSMFRNFRLCLYEDSRGGWT